VGPGSAGASVAGGSSLSWTHTVSGTSRLLTVGIAVGSGTDSGLSLSAAYNGVAMTSAAIVHSNNQTAGFTQLFYLVNPPMGAYTVQVMLAGGTADLEGGSVSFTGVNQTTPLRNAATNFGAGTSASMTVSSAAGDMVVDVVANGSAITSSGRTLGWLKNQNGNSAGGNAAQSTAAGASSVTMSYAVMSDWWGIIGADVVHQ